MARSSVDDLFRARAAEYGKAVVRRNKKEKTRIIDDLTQDTGYNRKYVIHKLSKIVFTGEKTLRRQEYVRRVKLAVQAAIEVDRQNTGHCRSPLKGSGNTSTGSHRSG